MVVGLFLVISSCTTTAGTPIVAPAYSAATQPESGTAIPGTAIPSTAIPSSAIPSRAITGPVIPSSAISSDSTSGVGTVTATITATATAPAPQLGSSTPPSRTVSTERVPAGPLPAVADPCPTCTIVVTRALPGGRTLEFIRQSSGTRSVWLRLKDAARKVIGVQPVGLQLAAPNFPFPGDLACNNAGTFCAAGYQYGAHGVQVALFPIDDTGVHPQAQVLNGQADASIVITEKGLIVGIATRTPDQRYSNAAAPYFWMTWRLADGQLVRTGCSEYNQKFLRTAFSGKCPPNVTFSSGQTAGQDPMINGPATAGRKQSAARFAAGAGTYRFSSPSYNINCQILTNGSPGGIECTIGKHRFPTPPKPDRDCTGAFGGHTSLSAKGALLICRGDPLPNRNAILDYGQTLEIAGVACLSTKSGVKCELADSSAGFILSQDEISTY